ncbi:MAG TPA: DUF3105 domain-containing protein [Pseudonocardiaceae bacterium]|jgi:hypothetical protein|nr:DUF3105 domain-containing protein [Pseudonocardiaceae bacterium]
MPSGKSSKAVRDAHSVVTATKPKPWGTVAAVLAIVVFAVGIYGYLFLRYEGHRAHIPTADNKDPSAQIEGVVTQNYGDDSRGHIGPDKRVAYDHSPPFGGPHDATWAACNGVVYKTAVRNENMVHALEHGAVWVAYNPDKITGAALQSLQDRVQGGNYIMLSPYPGLDSPISLQSWGHQLKLTDPADKRIDQFIQALRLNHYTYPEIGATCDVLTGVFDPAKPPPFVAEAPGPDAIPLKYTAGLKPGQGAAPPAPPAGG